MQKWFGCVSFPPSVKDDYQLFWVEESFRHTELDCVGGHDVTFFFRREPWKMDAKDMGFFHIMAMYYL